MRKVVTTIFILILSGLAATAATEAPNAADRPRTMDDVIDRVITNETGPTSRSNSIRRWLRRTFRT